MTILKRNPFIFGLILAAGKANKYKYMHEKTRDFWINCSSMLEFVWKCLFLYIQI